MQTSALFIPRGPIILLKCQHSFKRTPLNMLGKFLGPQTNANKFNNVTAAFPANLLASCPVERQRCRTSPL